MKVSIVINNYNYRAYVRRAIESALEQTHGDVEVIVVDDGSTDGSIEEIRRYAYRVQLIEKTNAGQGSAYNAGFRRSSGDLVIFLDADDWLYPQAAEQVAAAWRPGVSKLQFALELVDRDGRALGRTVPRRMHDRDALALLREFGAYGSPPGSGNAFARDFLCRVLPMDEPTWVTAADSVPILLSPAYGDVVSLPRPLGAYRLHRRDTSSLLANNAPRGLWHEVERIEWTKRFVERSLAALELAPRVPQRMAPWEARVVALCVRFGGPPHAGGSRASVLRLMLFALGSVWRWPAAGWPMKSALSAWMIAVWLLPRAWAMRLGRLHKTSMGAVHAA